MKISVIPFFSCIVCCSVLFFSCKEKETSKLKPDENVSQLDEKLIAPQAYYNLMNELEFNSSILNRLQVKSYRASYYRLDSSKLKIKETFTVLKPEGGSPRFYMIQARSTSMDTTVLEMMGNTSSDSESYSRRVLMPDGKINHFEISERYDDHHLLLQRKRTNIQTGKSEMELMGYTQGHLSSKELVGLGKEEYTYDELGNVTSYLLRNLKLDTIRYAIQLNRTHTIEVNGVKGGLDQFVYHYQGRQLNTIEWFQKGQLRVHFRFTYDSKGLLQTRIIQSSVKVFPSTRTDYQYTF